MAYSIGPVIKIDGEKEFRESIRQINQELRTLDTEMKAGTSAFEKNDKSVKNLTQQNKTLNQQLDLEKQKLNETNAMLQKSAEKYGENDIRTQKWKATVNSTTAEINKLEAQIKSNNVQIEKQSSSWTKFEKQMDSVKTNFKKVGDTMTSVGKGLSAGVTAPILAVGTAAMKAFAEVDSGSDAVIAATGATGQAAQDLDDVYKAVAVGVKGSFEDIGSAVGEVNTRFGFTGDTLQTASTDFMKFAEITGTDATDAVRLVSRAMGDAGIPAEEYGTLLDQLSVASQASGISIDKLTENITKYGAPMRELGFSTEESIAMFSKWESAGVNTEIAFSGMKKAISNFMADGKDAKVEFKNLVTGIQDGSVSSAEAMEIFGTKAGPDLIDAIKGGRFEYEDFLNVVQNSEGALDNTYDGMLDGADQMELSMKNVQVAFAGLGDAVGTVLAEKLDGLANSLAGIGEWFDTLSPSMQNTIINFGLAAAAAGPLLIAFGTVANAVSKVAALFGEAGLVGKIGAAVVKAGGFSSFISGTLAPVLTVLTGPIGLAIAAIAGLAAIFKLAWDNSEALRTAVGNAFSAIRTTIGDSLSRIMQAFQPFVTSLGGFGALFSTIFKNIGDSIAPLVPLLSGVLVSLINWVTDLIVMMAPLATVISNVVQLIINSFAMVVSILSGNWDAAFEYFQMGFQNLRNAVSGLLTWIANFVLSFFGTNLETVQQKLGEIIQAVQQFMAPLTNAISAAWNAVVTVTTTVWNDIKAYLMGIWNLVVTEITQNLNAIKMVIDFAWNYIQTSTTMIFSLVQTYLLTVWNMIKEQISQAVTTVKNTIFAVWMAAKVKTEEVWNAIRNFFTTTWEAIQLLFTVYTSYVRTIISGAWEFIQTTTSTFWNNIKKFLSDTWESVRLTINDKVEKVKTIISDGWNWINTKTAELWNAIKKFISDTIENVRRTVSEKADAIKNLINNAWQFVKDKTTEWWNAVKKYITDTIEEVRNKVNGKVDEIKNLVSNGWQAIRDRTVEKWNEIKQNIANAWGDMVHTATSKVDEMKSNVENGLANILTKIKDQCGRWVQAIKDKFEDMKNAGRDMFQKVLDGMTDWVANAGDKLKAVCDSLINKIREHFGIASPSKVMTEIGGFLIQGLIEGMEGENLLQWIQDKMGGLSKFFSNGIFSIVEWIQKGGAGIMAELAKWGVQFGWFSPIGHAINWDVIGWDEDFGDRTGSVGTQYHQGVDFNGSNGVGQGSPTYAIGNGTVKFAGYNGGYGNQVQLDLGNGLEAWYSHLDSINVAVGQAVSAGQQVGTIGNTGASYGAHLDFRTLVNGNFVDPKTILQQPSLGVGVGATTGGTLTDWINTAIAITGISPSNFQGLYNMAMGESGGIPTRIQDPSVNDINMRNGNPAKGLMQTIQSTFDAYKLPGMDNIFDPVHNLVASIRYQLDQYGRIVGHAGYAIGTRAVPRDMLANIHAGEMIVPRSENPYINSGGSVLAPVIEQAVTAAVGAYANGSTGTTNNYETWNINQAVGTPAELFRERQIAKRREAFNG